MNIEHEGAQHFDPVDLETIHRQIMQVPSCWQIVYVWTFADGQQYVGQSESGPLRLRAYYLNLRRRLQGRDHRAGKWRRIHDRMHAPHGSGEPITLTIIPSAYGRTVQDEQHWIATLRPTLNG